MAGGYDGVVVGDLAAVEDLLALLQLLARKWLYERCVGCEALQYVGAAGIDVVGEVGGVDAGVGGELLLVERLYVLQRVVGGEGEFLVALDLQAGEVEEAGWRLGARFLLYVGDGEVVAADGVERLLPLLGLFDLALGGGEGDAAVEGGEYPVFLWRKVLYLEMALDDHGQRGGLYAADGEDLAFLLREAYGVEARGVHAEEPVADGAAEAGLVETLVLLLRTQVGEGFADGLFGEAADPEALHGAGGLGFLHDPPLYEFAFLPGIAAVDDAVGGLHEALDGAELLLITLVVNEFNAEARRYHGQRAEAPSTPLVGVVLRLFEGAEVAEGPGDLVAVAFHIAIVRGIGAQHLGNLTSHRGFLSNTNYHNSNCKADQPLLFFLSMSLRPRVLAWLTRVSSSAS